MAIESASEIRQRFVHDLHRTQYHFQPPLNWMNDPNGFIQWNGKYHLFYQHNPFGPLWGNMHWGHTASDDLIHWEDLPIALAPTAGGPDEAGCFSGCAVNNGVPTFIYTGTRGQWHEIQTQCIATGDNDLIQWQKHLGNPVLAEVPAVANQTRDFRDPYVWKEADAWYMVVGSRVQDVGGAVFLYRSADLLKWEYLHPLLIGDKIRNGGIWECPNFFKLGDKWVLIVSAHVEVAVDIVLYFVGDFENHQFTPTYEGVLDYGQLYAPLSMLDDQHRRILIGWLRESRSPQKLEAAGWSGVQSIPRILTLENQQLIMKPVPALASARSKNHHYTTANVSDNGFFDVEGRALDITARFNCTADGDYGIRLLGSPTSPEGLNIVYQLSTQRLVIDTITTEADANTTHEETYRTVEQHFGFQEQVSRLDAGHGEPLVKLSQSVPLELAASENLELRILLDGSVVEIIANDKTSFTCRIYPSNAQQNKVQLIGRKESVDVIDIWEMSSIWQPRQS